MLHSVLPVVDTLVVQVLKEVDGLLTNYTSNGYQAVANYLRVPLGSITLIYITLFGFGISHGWIKMSMGNFVKAVIKVGAIYTVITNWGWVSTFIVDFIQSMVDGLGNALMSASPIHIPGIGGVDGAMQTTLIQFTKIGSVVFKTGGFTSMGGWLDGILLWGFGYAIVAIGLLEIILAKVMLAFLFVLMPLMVLGCFFKPFQGIFDRWLGMVVGFALLQVLVNCALALGLSLSYWWLGSHIGASALQIGNVGTLPIIIIGVVCIGLTLRAAGMAQALGGSVSNASGSAMVGGIIGGAIGSSMGGLHVFSGAMGAADTAMGSASGVVGRGYQGAKSVFNDIRGTLRGGGGEE